jgi:hypothetical protein
MTGGLMQLVAYGAQDVYLTANPQVTFFKQLYRRHSNFAMESIEQTFNGVANFGKRVTCTIARNGDLITKMYLQATLPRVDQSLLGESGYFYWIPYVGQFLIKSVEIEIGGQRIDKHYGDWLHIWNELTLPAGKGYNYLDMVNGYGGLALYDGNATPCSDCEGSPADICNKNREIANLAALGSDSLCCDASMGNLSGVGCIPETTLFVPFEFWFNRHTGLALPLIALQYHEVKVNIEFNELRYLCNTSLTSLSELNQSGLVAASLYVDYIFLDTEERRRFAQVAHEYLIEQLQFTGEESVTSTSNKITMSFNHPVKELIWVVQDPSNVDCNSKTNKPFCYADGNLDNPVAVAKVQLNGHDRFSEREGKYFNRVQPYQHHSASPATGINVYSFALKPEDLQPSGSCNFSRIDTATLHLTLTSATVGSGGPSSANVRIYATNYNVLRIMSGMGGLAYSN